MTISTVHCNHETWADEAEPDIRHGSDARIRVSNTSGARRWGFLFFGMPWPVGVGIIVNSATLRVFAAGTGWSGTHSVTAGHVGESWKEIGPAALCWDVLPFMYGDTYGSGASANNAASGDPIEFDVTTLIQNVADNSTGWHGFRLTVSTNGSKSIFSSDAELAEYHPQLEIDWELPVGYTTDLYPSGARAVDQPAPTLRWATTAPEHRVAVARDAEVDDDGKLKKTIFTSRWTEGKTHDLSQHKTFPKVKTDEELHWQVQLRSGPNNIGPWSPVASFTYKKRPTVKITHPDKATNDSTPVIKHTVDSQSAVRYVLRHDGRILYDSGRVLTTLKSFDIPVGHIVTEGEYEISVQVWDDVPRHRNMPTEARKKFRYEINGRSGITTVQQMKTSSPGIDLVWGHEGKEPTAFDIRMNDELLARVDAEEAEDGFGAYTHRIRRAGIPDEVELSVHPVYGRQTALGSPLTITNAVLNKWLSTSTIDVIMVGEDPDFNIGEDEALFFPPGRRDPIQVLQDARGYEGSFTGQIGDYAPQSVTADQQRDNFLAIVAARGTTEIRLAWRNIDIPIIMRGVSGPQTHTRAPWYDVGFEFLQIDDFTFTPA